ncbi:MAG: hypothetical protein RBR86_00110 [Pseudobdellovibrionaceae bacterium]|nr:hypothetical protein [Pseudobdellovibrionaceae bacterium]
MEKFDVDAAVQVVRQLYDKCNQNISLENDIALARLPTISRFKYEALQQRRLDILSFREPTSGGQKKIVSLQEKFETVASAVLPVFFQRMKDTDAPTSFLLAGKFCQNLADLHLMPVSGGRLKVQLLSALSIMEEEFWRVMQAQARKFVFLKIEEIMAYRKISYEDLWLRHHQSKNGELDSLEFILENEYHPMSMEILSAAELAFDMEYERVIPELIQAYKKTRVVTVRKIGYD